MDSRQLIDELLRTGSDLAGRGRDAVEQQLNLPEDPDQRAAMLNGLGKGAAAAGVLALLLGTSSGRRLTSGALKVGSVAALGTLAWKAWQRYQGEGTGGAPAQVAVSPLDALPPAEREARSLRLLRAVIAAARADGHIDDGERALIHRRIVELGLDASAADFIEAQLGGELGPSQVAEDVGDLEEAGEIYLASLLVLDEGDPLERAYARELASALQLPGEMVAELREQAFRAG